MKTAARPLAPAPGDAALPPPRQEGSHPHFRRSHLGNAAIDSEPQAGGAGAVPSPPPPPASQPSHRSGGHRRPLTKTEEALTEERQEHHHRGAWAEHAQDVPALSDASGTSPMLTPSALTENAVQRAFGNGADPISVSSPHLRSGDEALGVSAVPRPSKDRVGGIVMPTRKQDCDAASLYSTSQSVLPVDPRERIYYRPLRHLLQCYVERKKLPGHGLLSLLTGGLKSYQFFLEGSHEFLLAAVPRHRKSRSNSTATPAEYVSNGSGELLRPGSQGGLSSITFSINPKKVDDDARHFVGKLSRRGGGMEMVLFSEGSKAQRKELVAVLLDGFSDTSGSSFTVLLPAIDPVSGRIKPIEGGDIDFVLRSRGRNSFSSTTPAEFEAAMGTSSDDEDVNSRKGESGAHLTPATSYIGPPNSTAAQAGSVAPGRRTWLSYGSLSREYRRDPHSPSLIVLQSKAPQWDGALRGYKLDFHGRAAKASEKNFQLVSTTEPEKVVMLFGKQSDERFALDFRRPLCGIQAAAIATTIMVARKMVP